MKAGIKIPNISEITFMTLPSHLIAGLLIGKLTGNYPLAISASLLVDIDHIQSYIKSGVLFHPKELWRTITDADDLYGDQRGILHNILLCIVVSSILIAVLDFFALPIVIGWLGHLVLDALDKSDYWPLYPFKQINIKGFIPYKSLAELYFSSMLFIIFILI